MTLDGPRTIQGAELDSLSELVDTVFLGGPGGHMFRRFPQLFDARNTGNLFVFTEGSTVVSHAGLIRRWATLAGCPARVACVGAVVTAESHRGRGLASQLLEHICRQCKDDGVDFLLVSGRGPLYRRYGAAEVGRNYRTIVTRSHAAAISDRDVSIIPFEPGYLGACQAAYRRKTARFIRPTEDWEAFLASGYCMMLPSEILLVVRRGVFAGYFVAATRTHETAHVREYSQEGNVRFPSPPISSSILEYAGEETVLASALQAVMSYYGAAEVELVVEGVDRGLGKMLAQASCSLETVPAEGTLLLLNFSQLIQRLQPSIEPHTRCPDEGGVRFWEEDGRFHFCFNGTEKVFEGKRAAAEFLFGSPTAPPLDNSLAHILPIPTLHYGLNFV